MANIARASINDFFKKLNFETIYYILPKIKYIKIKYFKPSFITVQSIPLYNGIHLHFPFKQIPLFLQLVSHSFCSLFFEKTLYYYFKQSIYL